MFRSFLCIKKTSSFKAIPLFDTVVWYLIILVLQRCSCKRQVLIYCTRSKKVFISYIIYIIFSKNFSNFFQNRLVNQEVLNEKQTFQQKHQSQRNPSKSGSRPLGSLGREAALRTTWCFNLPPGPGRTQCHVTHSQCHVIHLLLLLGR